MDMDNTLKSEACLYAEDVGGGVADAGQRVEAEAAVLVRALRLVHQQEGRGRRRPVPKLQ